MWDSILVFLISPFSVFQYLQFLLSFTNKFSWYIFLGTVRGFVEVSYLFFLFYVCNHCFLLSSSPLPPSLPVLLHFPSILSLVPVHIHFFPACLRSSLLCLIPFPVNWFIGLCSSVPPSHRQPPLAYLSALFFPPCHAALSLLTSCYQIHIFCFVFNSVANTLLPCR